MKSVLFFMYAGFGLGMMLKMIQLYDKFSFDDKELNQWQMILFIVGMGFFWPLRWYEPVRKHFMMKVKDQDVWYKL